MSTSNMKANHYLNIEFVCFVRMEVQTIKVLAWLMDSSATVNYDDLLQYEDIFRFCLMYN